MKNKSKSSKDINPNRKFHTGQELIKNLDKLYQKSLLNKKKASVKNIFFNGFSQKKNYNKSNLKIKKEKIKEILNTRKKSLDKLNPKESVELKEDNEEEKNSIKINKDINNMSITDASLLSYKPEEKKFPKIPIDYYSSFLDKYKTQREERLFQSSIDFYLHRRKYLNKYINYKKEYIKLFNSKKFPPFSELKREPDLIAFGKIVPKEAIKVQKENKKNVHHKYVLLRAKSAILKDNNVNQNIYRTGLVKNHSIKKLKEHKLIKDDYTTNNANNQDYLPKDSFGNTIYPIYGQKKMLKNIMPKEYDYNTRRTPVELLHDTYHPLLRFQKKMLNQHINAINQEIGVTYSKYFTLIDVNKIPKKFQMCQELIDLQKDEKLIKLIRELIDRNFGLEREVDKALDLQKKEQEAIRKKYLFKRFSEVMLKASIHFKRLNISLEDFYSIPDYIQFNLTNQEPNEITNNENIFSGLDKDETSFQKKILMEKNGQHFFHALKAEDTDEIISIVNSNYFIMFYRDVFFQTPLHIAAKRNMYKFISLFVSRGANINAQDEGGRTALFIAAQQNNLEFAIVLLFEIADPLIKNSKGERPIDVTTDSRIKVILERAKILHYFHTIGKIKDFNESIRRGLHFLFKEEIGINYEELIDENQEIIKQCEK